MDKHELPPIKPPEEPWIEREAPPIKPPEEPWLCRMNADTSFIAPW